MAGISHLSSHPRARGAFAALAALATVVGVSAAFAANNPGVSTVAGSGPEGSSGDGGAATAARLAKPQDVAMLPGGGYLIADTKNHRIRKVSSNGTITTVAGTGDPGSGGDGGPADEADLDSPGGVAALPDGGFLIADTKNDRIREVDSDGDIDTVLGGSSGPGSGLLDKPQSVAALPGGDLLVADTGNHAIRRLSSLVVTTAAGTGSKGNTGDGGLAALAEVDAPYDVAPLPDGGFIFSDHDAEVVRKVDSLGVITTVAADLDGPAGLAALSAGGFLVVTEHDHSIRRVNRDGLVEPVAGTGSSGFADLADPMLARFDSPTGIAATNPGFDALVADTGNNRVRAIALELAPPGGGLGPAAPRPGNGETAAGAPAPVLGRKVAVARAKGVVRIRLRGSKRFRTLTKADAIPVGSTIDTRRGRIALSSALDSKGKIQTAHFWGGVFNVGQSRSGRGMTDIAVLGGTPRCGNAAAKASISKRRRSRRGAKLWAKDKRGRFRTRGSRSVATTRGTFWLTQERCTGTLTKVYEGAVRVRNRKTGRRVTVRAGKSYLAKRRR